jgi:hypothetical protein
VYLQEVEAEGLRVGPEALLSLGHPKRIAGVAPAQVVDPLVEGEDLVHVPARKGPGEPLSIDR